MYKIFKGFVIAGLMIVPQHAQCQPEVVEQHEVPAAKTYHRATVNAALLVVGGACLVAFAYYFGKKTCTDIIQGPARLDQLYDMLAREGVDLESIQVTTKIVPQVGRPFVSMVQSYSYEVDATLTPESKRYIDELVGNLYYFENLPSIRAVIAQTVAFSGIGSVMAYCGFNQYQHLDQQKSDQEFAAEKAAQQAQA